MANENEPQNLLIFRNGACVPGEGCLSAEGENQIANSAKKILRLIGGEEEEKEEEKSVLIICGTRIKMLQSAETLGRILGAEIKIDPVMDTEDKMAILDLIKSNADKKALVLMLDYDGIHGLPEYIAEKHYNAVFTKDTEIQKYPSLGGAIHIKDRIYNKPRSVNRIPSLMWSMIN